MDVDGDVEGFLVDMAVTTQGIRVIQGAMKSHHVHPYHQIQQDPGVGVLTDDQTAASVFKFIAKFAVHKALLASQVFRSAVMFVKALPDLSHASSQRAYFIVRGIYSRAALPLSKALVGLTGHRESKRQQETIRIHLLFCDEHGFIPIMLTV